MKYETIKSFILFVLVGLSFLLTFLLWSYQPNYESFYDTSYISETDVGGLEKNKRELIVPLNIVFHNDSRSMSFQNRTEQLNFYDVMTTWTFDDYIEQDASFVPTEEDVYVELIYPTSVPIQLIANMLTFREEIDPPDWYFQRLFITFDETNRTLRATILSNDGRRQVTAVIEKSDIYEQVIQLLEDRQLLEEYVKVDVANSPIYVPKDSVVMERKTFVASKIEPEAFINALFSNPSLVTPNFREAYFTDGQRGMRIVQDGSRLEYINPLDQSSYEKLTASELFDSSVTNINEHRGWLNDFVLDEIHVSTNEVSFRLYETGYPVFDYLGLTMIKQKWVADELREYNRPLVRMGNVLNSQEVELISGERVVQILENIYEVDLKQVQQLQVGYAFNYLEDGRSLTLEPSWFMLYQGEWTPLSKEYLESQFTVRGGD